MFPPVPVKDRSSFVLKVMMRAWITSIKRLVSIVLGRASVLMPAGLAIGGERGVARVLEIFRSEIELGLALLGCTSPEQVSPSHVEPTVPYDRPA